MRSDGGVVTKQRMAIVDLRTLGVCYDGIDVVMCLYEELAIVTQG